MFPIVSVLLSVAVTAVFFYASPLAEAAGKTRIDTLFYARYNECFLGLLLLLGISMFFDKERVEWKTLIMTAAVYLVLTAVMAGQIGNPEDKYLNVVSATGIHIFHWLGAFSVGKCALAALAGGIVFVVLCRLRLPYGAQRGLACFFLIFLFATTALYCMRVCIRGENDYTARYTELFDYLNENTRAGDVVYVCEKDKMAYDVQTRLIDKTVVSVEPEQLMKAAPGSYAVIRAENVSELPGIPYESCLEDEEYLVIMVER